MHSLDSEFLAKQLIPMTISSGLRKLGRYQGKQELLLNRRPQILKTLKEIAIVQSTESSNRIEGITVPSDRLKKILEENAKPQNRPEAQVLGYRNVLANIHINFNKMVITPEFILNIHREILKFTDLPRGTWKKRDNVIEERLPDGQWITRFIPTSARETPYYMEELCQRFYRLWRDDSIDRLLLIFAFIFDFLSIHPFSDGNGRISRLLTVLLLHQIRIDIPRYISFERMVEDTKTSYYEVLHTVSQGWNEQKHQLFPWLDYNITLLIASYQKLEERISIIDAGKGEKTSWVLEAIEQLPNEFTIGDLLRLCTGVSRPMVRHILENQREKGKLELIGLGRSAKWKKII